MANMLCSLRRFDKSEVAQERLRIIKFYDKHGEDETKEHFKADRKVISRWKKRLKEEGSNFTALIPRSTRPMNIRKPATYYKIIEFVREIREEHPRLGKEKIKPLLDKYCEKNGFKSISKSSIGNVIRRHKLFCQKAGKIYHNPDGKWAKKQVKKQKRERVKRSPKPKDFGYILSDTVERVTDGIKDYFYSAIDAKLKFALTLNYKRLNSRNMKDFYYRFKSVCPVPIKKWQSDNGSENLGEFDIELKKDKIDHVFIYPSCPKINSYIERYNRTIQEEFIDNHLDIIFDKNLFNEKLAKYLIFYNTERVHKSLGNKTPMDYLIEKGEMSHKSLTYTAY